MKELLFVGALILLLFFLGRRQKLMASTMLKPGGSVSSPVTTTPGVPTGSQQLSDNANGTANTTVIVTNGTMDSDFLTADVPDYIVTTGSIQLN